MQNKNDQGPKKLQDRLPVIAPSPKQPARSGFGPDRVTETRTASSRLPPRSRFGCWTCRTRKVKCDEARPKCTPCSRLGHPCDYSPRLSFKDDTPRVLEKMQPYTAGFSHWKRSVSWPIRRTNYSHGLNADQLPPFSMLSCDEDREKKAEYRLPGTYHIVANPSSFEGLEEYEGGHMVPVTAYRAQSDSVFGHQSSSANEEHFGHKKDIYEDPETLILGVFEDNIRKSPTLGLLTTHFSASPNSSQASNSPAAKYKTIQTSSTHYQQPPLLPVALRSQADHEIVSFYGHFVRSQLNQVHRDSLGTSSQTESSTTSEVLDKHADIFLPLYHALMAFSALSMAHSQGIQNLNALQHYSKALPSLQSSLQTSRDLSSDGALLTHFLLLLYEIAAAEPRGSNLWSQHLGQLHRIVRLRREMYGLGSFPFVVWWVLSIDTHSVLTGSGRGEFVEAMLAGELLPYSELPKAVDSPNISSSSLISKAQTTPSVLEFHRVILILAARLGLLARDLRQALAKNTGQQTHSSRTENLQHRERVEHLREVLRRTWSQHAPTYMAMGYGNERVPVSARGIFEHTYALYHACIIYSHTSMWSSQRLDGCTQPTPECSYSIYQILQLAREINDNGYIERKFMVFPLFMAGIATQDPMEQQQVMQLLVAFEKRSIGRAMVATRHILEIIYAKQREVIISGSNPLMVDWVDTIAQRGLQMIDARL